MISKYSNFTESSNSSSSSILANHQKYHHINSFPDPHINNIYNPNNIYNSPYIPYPTFHTNLGSIGNQIISPNYYSHKTISYNNNKNNFMQGEPVPIHEDLKNKCCSHGCNTYISDILYLLKEMKGLNLDKKLNIEKEEESETSEGGTKKHKKKKKDKKKKKKEKEEEKKGN